MTDEADALRRLGDAVAPAIAQAAAMILGSPNQLIVTGLGKSGLIAAKIAATLASTGTSAKYLHPVDGLHGDLGVVQEGDPLLALSKSGRTDEVSRFVTHFKRIGGAVIGMCEAGPSPLADLSQIVIPLPALPEAGPLQLAPTTSTTMMLAAGDALAMALLDARGFRPEQFARYHPEGSLGKRLLLRAADVMHGGDQLPHVRGDATYHDLLLEITKKRIGMTTVVETDGRLLGVFTDGDLRRLWTRVQNPQGLTARDAWKQSRRDQNAPPVPHSAVAPDTLAVECLRIMREAEITTLVVAGDDGRPAGIVRLQDLVHAGLG